MVFNFVKDFPSTITLYIRQKRHQSLVLQIWQMHETKTLGRSLHDQLFNRTTFDNVVYMSSDIKLNMVIEEADYWHSSAWLLSQQFLRWNYVEVWQSSQTCNKFFLIWRGLPRVVLRPKCNSQFLVMVTQMKYLFFFFHIMQSEFHTRHVTGIMHEPWQSV